MRALAALLCLASLPGAAQDKGTGPAEAALLAMQNGDAACFLTLRDAAGREARWPAVFDLCDEKLMRPGRRYAFRWREEQVMHPSCQGDVTCRRRLRVMLAVEARPLSR